VGDVGRPAAGLVDPEVRAGADGAPVGIPVDGIPVDGKFKPLDDPPDIGIDGLAVGVVGLKAPGVTGRIGPAPSNRCRSCSAASVNGGPECGFRAFGSTCGRWSFNGSEFGLGGEFTTGF
jgi:hypothetical protein